MILRNIDYLIPISQSKDPMSFKEIYGDKSDCRFEGFLCLSGCNLNSLEGCPAEVIGSFSCSENLLENLIGGPKKVSGVYYCNNNKLLKSLEGVATYIGDTLECSSCVLENLDFFPQEVEGRVNCSHNKLSTLGGLPQIINGNFNCSENPDLISLTGGPKLVKGDYNCSCCSLTSLNGVAEEILGSFLCNSNQIKSLELAPKSVNYLLHCGDNDLEDLNWLFTSGIEKFNCCGNNFSDYRSLGPILTLNIKNNIDGISNIEADINILRKREEIMDLSEKIKRIAVKLNYDNFKIQRALSLL